MRVAIIIPVWHHPALVDEAILSCLQQDSGENFQIILVNDGCDLAQTRESLEGWARAYPDAITLLNQPNLGLSAARNAGIEQALKCPSTEAIFFLDADNRLDSHAFRVFAQLLESESGAGWFYPQFDRFGMEANISNGGRWSLSRLAIENFCEAGSLVKRAVFDSGLRFDTAFKAGFEDWDFWLGAAKNGFYGTPIMQSFFRYRRRPESMLANAERQKERLKAQLQEKHRWLFQTPGLNEARNREWPRFALIGSDGQCALGSDPLTANPISHDDLIQEIYGQRANPGESDFPPILLFHKSGVIAQLAAAKLVESCFHQIEGGFRHGPVVGVNITAGAPDIERREKQQDAEGDLLFSCDIIAVSLHHLNAALDRDEMADIVQYLIANVPVVPLEVRIPVEPVEAPPAIAGLMDLIGGLILSPLAQVDARQYRNWRTQTFPQVGWQVEQLNAGGRPALARKGRALQVGFVTQVFNFGGVEKCIVALAAALGKHGVACHLFVYGNDPTEAADWMFYPFEKVWILKDAALRDWGGNRYLGTPAARAPSGDLMGDMLGPLTHMDVVVNSGAGVLNHGQAALRERGIKVVAWEHVTEGSHFGRDMGTPLLTVGYEAGFDKIITCSQQLTHRMAAFGVPRSKLLPLPNGPGYVVQQNIQRQVPDGRLRVGFLGRFDPQKQVERFVDVATALRGEFEFTICGAAVLGNPMAFPAWLTPRPPIKSRDELDAFYASIDVLIMPSKDEGLPLTILEAQRAGVVVLASDVGAVQEAIVDGETGFLLQADRVVADAIETLKRLDKDRRLLGEIAKNAIGKPDQWQQNAALFMDSLF